MMFHMKDDGMEGCPCVRLLQVGENIDWNSVEWTSDRKQSECPDV